MKRSYIGLALGALVMVGAALSLPSCGHDRKLVSIAVHPALATYPTPQAGLVQFSAIATYIHPPATSDITGQVIWQTDVPELLTLNVGGVAGAVEPSGAGCGIADISATAREGTGGAGNIVIGYATVTVEDPTGPLCPGSSATNGELVVTPAGAGTGTVTSQPGGIICPGTACGAQFPAGDLVTLTASPGAGSSFGGWTGCTAGANPNQCPVTIPGGSIVNVTAAFTSP
jgi:Divergent InlB B-repeat domain